MLRKKLRRNAKKSQRHKIGRAIDRHHQREVAGSSRSAV
jgi:hypothetical protein